VKPTPTKLIPDTTDTKAAAASKQPATKRPAAKKTSPGRKAATPNRTPAPSRGAVKVAAVKVKLIRDSFTMPEADFALIDALKTTALEFKRPTKKSELLRAGLQALAKLKPAQLQAALDKLPAIKTGRPKKADKSGK
jgi:hypothetical protein